jgi:plastocyanin
MTSPITIRVTHPDPENQLPFPPANRLFEYADFFSRAVTVHRGDTVNFQAQPFSFNIVALAADEPAARAAYPIIELRTADAPVPGSGAPGISFGNGAFPVVGGSTAGGGEIHKDKGKGPPVAGVVQFGQPPYVFVGGDSVEVIGPTVGWDLEQRPALLDQHVVIDAPPGEYRYFDMLHPGMSGTLTVVPDGEPVSTQAEVDAASERQFQESRAQAMAVETFLNSALHAAGAPGDRDIMIFNGVSVNHGRVLVNAVLPAGPVQVGPGDRVHFLWGDDYGIHALGFAPRLEDLPSPFGFDCGDGAYQSVPNTFNAPPPDPCVKPGFTEPQFLCDPGDSPAGTALAKPDEIINAGLLIGRGYGLAPTTQSWTVRITSETAKGQYRFFDAVHPWMTGVLNVT